MEWQNPHKQTQLLLNYHSKDINRIYKAKLEILNTTGPDPVKFEQMVLMDLSHLHLSLAASPTKGLCLRVMGPPWMVSPPSPSCTNSAFYISRSSYLQRSKQRQCCLTSPHPAPRPTTFCSQDFHCSEHWLFRVQNIAEGSTKSLSALAFIGSNLFSFDLQMQTVQFWTHQKTPSDCSFKLVFSC